MVSFQNYTEYIIYHIFQEMKAGNEKNRRFPQVPRQRFVPIRFFPKITKKDEKRLDFYMFEDIFTEKSRKQHIMNPQPEKKKTFIMFPSVKDFMREQSGDVKKELNGIVFLLERDGTLSYPYAEKIQGEDLFAIRIIQAGNIRIFYVYGLENRVYAVHGYVKKTQEIPQREMAIARKVLKWLIQKGLVS